jgi:hypothetical protein
VGLPWEGRNHWEDNHCFLLEGDIHSLHLVGIHSPRLLLEEGSHHLPQPEEGSCPLPIPLSEGDIHPLPQPEEGSCPLPLPKGVLLEVGSSPFLDIHSLPGSKQLGYRQCSQREGGKPQLLVAVSHLYQSHQMSQGTDYVQWAGPEKVEEGLLEEGL